MENKDLNLVLAHARTRVRTARETLQAQLERQARENAELQARLAEGRSCSLNDGQSGVAQAVAKVVAAEQALELLEDSLRHLGFEVAK